MQRLLKEMKIFASFDLEILHRTAVIHIVLYPCEFPLNFLFGILSVFTLVSAHVTFSAIDINLFYMFYYLNEVLNNLSFLLQY